MLLGKISEEIQVGEKKNLINSGGPRAKGEESEGRRKRGLVRNYIISSYMLTS